MQYDDDVAFQRAILANPADTTLKLVYADWLQDRADPRAEFVRLQIDIERAAAKYGEGERWARRESVSKLGESLDPVWVGFMNTLAQPFEPITFQEGEPGHPFRKPVGNRGRVVVFESQYRTADTWDTGLLTDLTFLANTEWGWCAYGAMDRQISGFMCELPSPRTQLNEENVLILLKAADFDYDHQDTWPDTIEIRTEFEFQYMFDHDDRSADDGAHGLLRRYVQNGRLWYVLLHIGGRPCDMVTLLAVGRSPHGNRLVGAITSQACHNFCD